VHRIGRTARRGKTGLATTFISKSVTETMLLDLKQLLIESKQRIPSFLQIVGVDPEHLAAINSPDFQGCNFCGGLAHVAEDCPKMMRNAERKHANSKDVSGGDW
jgi:ATP-dependent RNA helicase DDX41